MTKELRYTSPPLRRALGKPILTVLKCNLPPPVPAAAAAALIAGEHGAISATVGGAVSIAAGMASALVALAGRAKSAGGVLVGALRAEAVKIGLALVLLGLVLSNYAQVAVGALLGTFIVTMVIFSMAFFVREY
jgi:ATP synthase protein I